MLFNFIHGDERTAHIVHEAAEFKGRPVGDIDGFETFRPRFMSFGELSESLCGADHTNRSDGRDIDGVGCYV